MLNSMNTQSFQTYVAKNGSASSLLYYGTKNTKELKASLIFKSKNEKSGGEYKLNLIHAVSDTLIFKEEKLTNCYPTSPASEIFTNNIPSILSKEKESILFEYTKMSDLIYKKAVEFISNFRVFQFHDTTSTANIRNKGYINNNKYLYSDAGNLAAFLYTLKNTTKGEKYYQRIVRYIQQIMPQFNDFELEPSALNENYIILNWKEKDSDYLFGAHQISDGSLRFMALVTLLLQPPETLPSVIVLDEPELGLHPSAISILAGMTKAASKYCQVIIATQSPRLVDEYETDNIVIVERDTINNCSIFKKLDNKKLSEWIERYSLSELWEKNVIGGQP